jgi:hypothetical protein
MFIINILHFSAIIVLVVMDGLIFASFHVIGMKLPIVRHKDGMEDILLGLK